MLVQPWRTHVSTQLQEVKCQGFPLSLVGDPHVAPSGAMWLAMRLEPLRATLLEQGKLLEGDTPWEPASETIPAALSPPGFLPGRGNAFL